MKSTTESCRRGSRAVKGGGLKILCVKLRRSQNPALATNIRSNYMGSHCKNRKHIDFKNQMDFLNIIQHFVMYKNQEEKQPQPRFVSYL